MIIFSIFVVFRLSALAKPFMLVRGMVDDEVKHALQASLVTAIDYSLDVFEITV